jgi:hypothetical protein
LHEITALLYRRKRRRNPYPAGKAIKRRTSEYRVALIGFLGAVTGALIVTIPQILIQQTRYVSEKRINEYVKARENIAMIFDIHNTNLQIYLYSANVLKGEELYSPRQEELWEHISYFPNRYDANIEVHLNAVRSYVLRYAKGGKQQELLRAVNDISYFSRTLYEDFFFDINGRGSMVWKEETMPNMVILDVFGRNIYEKLTLLLDELEPL